MTADLILEFLESHRPCLLMPEAFTDLVAKAERLTEKVRVCTRARSGAFEAAVGGKSFPRQGASWDGNVELPGMSISNGIADIPIYGVIGDKIDPFAKWYFDATDLRDVNRELDIAASDPTVRGYVFTVDSPGGSSRGVPEAADRILGIKKPKMTYVDGMAASAAYWLSASTDQIYTTRGGDVGSIGVYTVFRDMSKLADSLGIKVQVFASGKYKGAGFPGTSLTGSQSEWIQKDVEALASDFKSAVRFGRGRNISDETMQGQIFGAPAALSNGLIDGIVRDKGEVLSLL